MDFWLGPCGCERVFKLQRRAIRLISGLPYRADCRNSRKLLHIKNPVAHIIHESVHYHEIRGKNSLVPSYHRLKKCQNGPNCLAIRF